MAVERRVRVMRGGRHFDIHAVRVAPVEEQVAHTGIGRIEVGIEGVEQAVHLGLSGIEPVPELAPLLENDPGRGTAHPAAFAETGAFLALEIEVQDSLEKDVDQFGQRVLFADNLVGELAHDADVAVVELVTAVTVYRDGVEAVVFDLEVHPALRVLHRERVLGVEVHGGVDILEYRVAAEHLALVPRDQFPCERGGKVPPCLERGVGIDHIAGFERRFDPRGRFSHVSRVVIVLFPDRYAEHKAPFRIVMLL